MITQRRRGKTYGTHVHCALHAELGANGGGSNTVLTGTSLGNNLGLAEPLSQKELANGIVNLVAAGVVEVLALQPDVGTTSVLSQAAGQVQLGLAAHVVVVGSELLPESRVVLDLVETFFELREAVHQALGDVLATEIAKAGRDSFVHGSQLRNQCLILLGGNDGIGHCGVAVGSIGRNSSSGIGGNLSLITATQGANVLLERGGDLTRGSVANGADNLAADNDTVGQAGNAVKVLVCADTEANSSGLVATVALDTLDQVADARWQAAGGTSDAHARNDVDEGVGKLAENLHAGVRGEGGNERDVGQAALVAELAEGNGLFGGKVDDDEAVDAGGLAVGQEALLAVAEEGVIVAHDEDGDLEAQ